MANIQRRVKWTVYLVMLCSFGCGGVLAEAMSETQQNRDMLSKCRAEARQAYYVNDAGLEKSLAAYENCKSRDAGGNE